MLGLKDLTYLIFVAELGSSEEQIAVAPIGSPLCEGTPETNAQVQDVLNFLGDAMTSAETATEDNINSSVQQVKDLTAKAIEIANAPDFQMDAEGRQFVYDWDIKKGEQAARFLAAARLPLSDLDNYRAVCAEHPIYDISTAFLYSKAFGECYDDYNKVLELNSQISCCKMADCGNSLNQTYRYSIAQSQILLK